ncbi:MAG: class C sortase [Lachnospiraceae bacterium]|nr:class C sortase [Lachnospiraceae bacterium]
MKKRTWITALLVIMLLAGLSLLLYPTFADYWNSTRQSGAVMTYVEDLDHTDEEAKKQLWEEAVEYNKQLSQRTNPYHLPEELRAKYGTTLDVSGSGIMGYVDIPAISVQLPIYHGTEESVLQRAVGHLEWTYLPVGGAGTHAVVSGHRGLPSAKLFTDLNKVVVGDLFMLQVLDETLTYEVDRILIVEPEDVTALLAEPGRDLCTLVTCTPYGVNTHRLLVRGHRIENVETARTVRIVSEATQIDPMIVATALAVPMVLLLLLWIMLRDIVQSARRRRQRQKASDGVSA